MKSILTGSYHRNRACVNHAMKGFPALLFLAFSAGNMYTCAPVQGRIGLENIMIVFKVRFIRAEK